MAGSIGCENTEIGLPLSPVSLVPICQLTLGAHSKYGAVLQRVHGGMCLPVKLLPEERRCCLIKVLSHVLSCGVLEDRSFAKICASSCSCGTVSCRGTTRAWTEDPGKSVRPLLRNGSMWFNISLELLRTSCLNLACLLALRSAFGLTQGLTDLPSPRSEAHRNIPVS